MTHKDILTKFMIEYDKSNITSSYPSLTNYEIVTVLNKAYLALIAQKLTGNNQRKVAFEYDTKAIEDLRPLIETDNEKYVPNSNNEEASNDYIFNVPESSLYVIQARIKYDKDYYNAVMINHALAHGFMVSSNNKPWIEQPVYFLEGNYIHALLNPDVLYDTEKLSMNVTYISEPTKFGTDTINGVTTNFELSDTVAEELINLAIAMSLEIVESTRLSTKSSLLSLES